GGKTPANGGEGPSTNRFNVLYDDYGASMEAGEDMEADVAAMSQGVAAEDSVLRHRKLKGKDKVVTGELDKSEQVVENSKFDDHVARDSACASKLAKSMRGKIVVENSLNMEVESDSDRSEKGMGSSDGPSEVGPTSKHGLHEDGLDSLCEEERPVGGGLPKGSVNVNLGKPKDGFGRSQGLHPRKTSSFKVGGPKIKENMLVKSLPVG
ncbi:hypothetical protein CCACVL1_03949, partial [Corchorus capsularis]